MRGKGQPTVVDNIDSDDDNTESEDESLKFGDESDRSESDSDDSSSSCGGEDVLIYSSADNSADVSSDCDYESNEAPKLPPLLLVAEP